jgi:hypothetical protein
MKQIKRRTTRRINDFDRGYDDRGETQETYLNSKSTNTAFILMFPALILAILAAAFSPVWGSLLAIALAAYQFLMLKKFIEDYYNK